MYTIHSEEDSTPILGYSRCRISFMMIFVLPIDEGYLSLLSRIPAREKALRND